MVSEAKHTRGAMSLEKLMVWSGINKLIRFQLNSLFLILPFADQERLQARKGWNPGDCRSVYSESSKQDEHWEKGRWAICKHKTFPAIIHGWFSFATNAKFNLHYRTEMKITRELFGFNVFLTCAQPYTSPITFVWHKQLHCVRKKLVLNTPALF